MEYGKMLDALSHASIWKGMERVDRTHLDDSET